MRLAVACIALATAATAQERPPPDDELTVVSATYTDTQFLRGEPPQNAEVELSGTLRLPNHQTGLPVVILLHGSEGVASGAVAAWRQVLDRAGLASFRLDSFTGRGIESVEADQSQLGLYTQIYDAFRAVETLAADPRIDPDRIVLMGFSRGGTAALYAAMTRFQDDYGPQNGRLLGYVAAYPSCAIPLARDTEVAGAPIRIFHGAEDDWVPAPPCRAYVERLRTSGRDAAMTEYPGVGHAFDNPSATPGLALSNAPTARNCRRAEVDGVIVNLETGLPFTFADACVETGVTVGYDEAAAADMAASVLDLFEQVFAH